MISANHVTKRYGKLVANSDISLQVMPGELCVLLGPNGAGKSTLIKSICGLLRFDGRIEIGGHENHTTDAKRLLGYVPEMPALYPMLTVWEHLAFIARAYNLGDDWTARAEGMLDRFELMDKRDSLGKQLSKGMQQKLSLTIALLPQPKALILDEPLIGLDPHAIRALKDLLNELKAQQCALMMSTHMIESVEDNWDATHIMMGGRLARTVRRDELSTDESLEDVFFQITEGDVNHA
ncbi:ABC transporter ATP-binding protein [Eubacteriales bacterium OttesenSCG-928-N13]|nr:ABC transporter ATP-binding protein [Eubacteriales bacterium OttesenSCG-928-N13]